MYFEDEKEIDNGKSLHIEDDGTVSWDDILADTPDEEIEVLDDSSDSFDEDGSNASAGDASANSSDFLDDEIEYSDTPAEDEIANAASADYSAETYSKEDTISDDFDIDKQLEQVSTEETQGNDKDFVMPSKQGKKVNLTTLLLALLVAVAVMGGIYYYFNFMHNSSEELVPPSTKTQMDNMTQEQLEERTNEEASETAEEPAQDESIEVVNDDNIEELKPDEPEKEDKKQVISIVPTGRINPFLPLQKYMQIEDTSETIVQYDKAGIPTPPLQIEEKNEDAEKMLTISVSGIMYDNVKPSAIITLDDNDYFVQKGDKLDEYKVIEIGRNYVTIALGKNLYKANVGEEFKISSKFYGNAEYIPQKDGGGRQYHSVDNQRNIKEVNVVRRNDQLQTKNYTSEDDVVIKSK